MAKQKLIVPGYARNNIMKELLKDNDLLFGKEVLSLSAFKSSLLFEETDNKAEKTKLFLDIQDNISKDNIYREQLKFPAFFDYFYQFANLLASNRIKAEQLPDDDKDRKEILTYLLNSELIQTKLANAFDELEDASDCEIYDYFYPELNERKEINKLIAKGGSLYEKRKHFETEFECFLANNSVQEVIAVAQYLIKEKEKKDFDLNDYVLMVCDQENYLPIIRRIFDNYNLPYSFSINKPNKSALRFLALLKLIRNQDITSFVEAYNQEVFGFHDYVLNEYIEDFDPTYEQLLDFKTRAQSLLSDENKKVYLENTFGIDKYEELAEKEKRCQEIMNEISKIIGSTEFISLKDQPLKKQCSHAYEYLFGSPGEENSETVNEIRDLKETLLSIVKREINDDEKLFVLLCYELEKMTIEADESCDDPLLISDPYQNAPGKSCAIILGCSQQNYPRSIALNGFFDEEYMEKIEGIDPLIERSSYFESEYDSLLHQFKHVIFSCPVGSVDGDKYEISTLISEYVDKLQAWKISLSDHYQNKVEKISTELAEEIYLRNGILYASPSSLSTYVMCPFKYYIEKGLRLKEEDPLKIEANTIGRIQHSLLERMFNNDLPDGDLETQLEPYFEMIKQIMFNDQEYIDGMKKRLVMGLDRAISFLKKFMDSDDHHYYPEEKIAYLYKDNEPNIKVRGSIDRLDKDDKGYRIIDYKSSEKQVKIDDVKKGINFQLLSYLVFYFMQLQEEGKQLKDPELFAYFSLKNKTLKKSDEDKNFELTDQQIRDNDTRYLSYLLDGGKADERFFEKAKADKSDTLSFERLKEITLGLFENISKMIMSGDISINPANNACKFCKYQEICHHSADEMINKSEMPYIYKEQGDDDGAE
ncbi:MAG: PD-(D/E)XK nuclease family protein [Erysipelotrichaceae bacterium]|nr:PD-(D/E)XK nuclease family protein [Erysipelotrichaceae bacterium]